MTHATATLYAALLALALAAPRTALAQAANVDDSSWGCYDAQPGHPTSAEKAAFIAAMVPAAQAAEQGGGPPAPGLLAMSALESGFGWTRTALFAQNMFGWKFTGATAAGGRTAWTLTCQPTSDHGNRYIVFRDGADSMTFVAGRLASIARYASVTRRYHTDRAAGVPVNIAVETWVRGIAKAGYNPFPNYPTTVVSIANNYLHPAPTPSAELALFQYATAPKATPPAATGLTHSPPASAGVHSGSAQAAAKVLDASLKPSRYLSERCDPAPITAWPGYEGRNVIRCQYSVTSAGKRLLGLVYLLNPSKDNLVVRIEDACRTVGLADRLGCGRRLANWIIGQNGGQFPVAGFVVERKQDAGGKGPDPVYLEFRDGCTIDSTDHLNFTDSPLTADAMEHAARAQVASTRRIARIANATRVDYARAGGKNPVGTSPAEDQQNRWLKTIRDNELSAQDGGPDILLRGVAMGMRAQLGQN